MLVYYFVPFIVSNRYLLFWVSNGHNSVTVQNQTHVYMNFFDHKDLGNHLLQLCPKVVKHPVYRRAASCTSILSSLAQNTDVCAQLHEPCDVTQGSLTKCQQLHKNNLTIQSVWSSQEWFCTSRSHEYHSTTSVFHYLTHCRMTVGLDVFASNFYTSPSHVPFIVFSATPSKPPILILKCRFTWQHVHMCVHTCTFMFNWF